MQKRRHESFFLAILTVLGMSCLSFISKDSIAIARQSEKIKLLSNNIQEIRRDQLNYKIEKDTLKEVYETNYETINQIITIILAIAGITGYLGIRDIYNTKREYSNELEKLRKIQEEVTAKALEFESAKAKYDSDFTTLIKANEEQNRKIKILELKEKIRSLLKEDRYNSALEFCIVALELDPNDIQLLYMKAEIYCRTLNYKESIDSYNKILKIDPNDKSATANIAEVYLMDGNLIEYNNIIKNNSSLFEGKESDLLKIFDAVIAYHKDDPDRLEIIIKEVVSGKELETKQKHIQGWIMRDLLIFIANQPDSSKKKSLQNLIWFVDGQLSAKDLLSRIGATM